MTKKIKLIFIKSEIHGLNIYTTSN